MSPEVISLLLPTRQRPRELTRLAESAIATATYPDKLELVTFIDLDDDSYDGLLLPGIDWKPIRGPRFHDDQVNLSVKWNHCWQLASGGIFMHCGDDIVFRTQGWDEAVREVINAAPAKIAFVWCDDYGTGSDRTGSDRSDFGTHGFVHHNWTDVVGRFVPPYFVSDFNDTWFNDVGTMLGVRRYIPHHLTEHMHYIFQKAEIDQNTQERLERHSRERPDQLYFSPEMEKERRAEAVKLQEFIEQNS